MSWCTSWATCRGTHYFQNNSVTGEITASSWLCVKVHHHIGWPFYRAHHELCSPKVLCVSAFNVGYGAIVHNQRSIGKEKRIGMSSTDIYADTKGISAVQWLPLPEARRQLEKCQFSCRLVWLRGPNGYLSRTWQVKSASLLPSLYLAPPPLEQSSPSQGRAGESKRDWWIRARQESLNWELFLEVTSWVDCVKRTLCIEWVCEIASRQWGGCSYLSKLIDMTSRCNLKDH